MNEFVDIIVIYIVLRAILAFLGKRLRVYTIVAFSFIRTFAP